MTIDPRIYCLFLFLWFSLSPCGNANWYLSVTSCFKFEYSTETFETYRSNGSLNVAPTRNATWFIKNIKKNIFKPNGRPKIQKEKDWKYRNWTKQYLGIVIQYHHRRLDGDSHCHPRNPAQAPALCPRYPLLVSLVNLLKSCSANFVRTKLRNEPFQRLCKCNIFYLDNGYITHKSSKSSAFHWWERHDPYKLFAFKDWNHRHQEHNSKIKTLNSQSQRLIIPTHFPYHKICSNTHFHPWTLHV